VPALENILVSSWNWRSSPETPLGLPKRIEQLIPKYPPPFLHVLIAIAFVRDNVPLLETLVRMTPPKETVFDDINITERLSGSPLDLDAWTTVLKSSWIHRPNSPWHRIGWMDLLTAGMTNVQRGDEKKLERFAKAMRSHGLIPDIEPFRRVITSNEPVNPANLETVFSVFPARSLGADGSCLIRNAVLTHNPLKGEVIRCLVNAGLNPNWIEPIPKREHPITDRDDALGDYYGRVDRETALHTAAARGDLELVRLLLECGAKSSVRDGHGRTAKERANANGHVEVVNYLEGRWGWFKGFFKR
jgi:hypothetical protein